MNAVMHRTTGLMLTRETPQERRAAIAAARREAAAATRAEVTAEHRRAIEQMEQRRAERRAAAAKRREERKRERQRERQAAKAERAAHKAAEKAADRARREQHRRARMLAQYDEAILATIERVSPQTMTSAPKLAALIEATRYVARSGVPGDVVECGVWRGGSMQAVALTLIEMKDTDRHLHLFDTFEGMPPPTEEDTRLTEGGSVSAEQLLAESAKDTKMWGVAGLDVVREAMADTGYPSDRVHFHPGLVEETTPAEAPDTIALLRLDTDWYSSTKHELHHLYSRLSPGGVLVLDDYGDWDGARKATDEWLEETGEPLLLVPMGSGRIAIKPRVTGS